MAEFDNAFAGKCAGCGRWVPAREGTSHLNHGIRRDFWTVRCAACPSVEVQPQHAEPIRNYRV